jgi:sugar-specific transcriptional regulator TrmB
MFDLANKQIVPSLLGRFGLDEIEAQVYLYLLQNGSRTPLDLSREISINRSRIYRYIDRLVGKKLVEVSGEERGRKLKASNPSNLELLIQEEELKAKSQREVLPELLKELTRLPAKLEKEFEVRHYHGIEGLRQMLWNHLSTADRQILAYCYQNRNEMVGKQFAEKIREEQVFKKVMLYEIQNESDKGSYWYTDVANWGKYYTTCEISPKIMEIKQYIAIVNNTVSICNWVEGERVGIEIENSTYAKAQRQLFWTLWGISKEPVKIGQGKSGAKK